MKARTILLLMVIATITSVSRVSRASGTVLISGPYDDVTIFADGKVASMQIPYALFLTDGDHRLEARYKGYIKIRDVVITEGVTLKWDIDFSAVDAEGGTIPATENEVPASGGSGLASPYEGLVPLPLEREPSLPDSNKPSADRGKMQEDRLGNPDSRPVSKAQRDLFSYLNLNIGDKLLYELSADGKNIAIELTVLEESRDKNMRDYRLGAVLNVGQTSESFTLNLVMGKSELEALEETNHAGFKLSGLELPIRQDTEFNVSVNGKDAVLQGRVTSISTDLLVGNKALKYLTKVVLDFEGTKIATLYLQRGTGPVKLEMVMGNNKQIFRLVGVKRMKQ